MIFIQQDVDAIVARAKELGAGPGLTYKQDQFSLQNFEGRGPFDVAMCLVNGWDLIQDLVHAFRATIQVLCPGDPTFEAKEILGILTRAVHLIGEQRQVSFGERSLRPAEFCRVLVTSFAERKYDLIYAHQALIEYCAYAGNHSSLVREAYRPSLENSLFPAAMAVSGLWSLGTRFGGYTGGSSVGVRQTPEPPPRFDGAWYQARAQERRDQRATRRQENQRRTDAGKERAKIRV